MEPYINKTELVGKLLGQCNKARKDLVKSTVLRDIPVSIHHWPAQEIEKFLGSHVGYYDRLSLSYFLLGNGMTPNTLVDWCTAQSGYLAHQHSAMHMASIIESHGNGDFDGKTYWDVQWNEMSILKAPPFSKETHSVMMKCYDIADDGIGSLGLPYWDHMRPGFLYWEHAAKAFERYAKELRVKPGTTNPNPRRKKGTYVSNPAPDAETAAKWADEAEEAAREMLLAGEAKITKKAKIKRCGPLGDESAYKCPYCGAPKPFLYRGIPKRCVDCP